MRRIVIILLCLATMTARAQTFSIDTISDAVFQRMLGKSYKYDCTVARADLRYLRIMHYDGKGREVQGELVCNKLIANDLLEIFKELHKQHYPIEQVRLIDDYDSDDERSMQANNTSCFNYRAIAGSTKLSKHSQGLAIDINPLYNPCVRHRKDGKLSVEPQNGRPYANRKKSFPYKIDKNDLCYRLFTKHGFKWGGEWRSLKDYQHFER